MKAFEILENIRQKKHIIENSNKGTYNVWLEANENNWVISYSRYVGPRHIRATAEITIKRSSNDNQSNLFKIIKDIKHNDMEYTNHAKYTDDEGTFEFFKKGIMETIRLQSFSYAIYVVNLICEDVESSLMSFKQLGNIVGDRINIIDNI